MCSAALTDTPVESYILSMTDWTTVVAVILAVGLIKGNNIGEPFKS